MNDADYEDALKAFTEASGVEDKGQIEEAIKLYEEAVSLGFTPAMTNLGNIYDDKVNPSNPEKAEVLYLKAASLGDAVGTHCLAVHYGAVGHYDQYKIWVKRAREMGYED